MYYKLIDGKNIVGVISSSDFRRLQKRHKLVLFADEETAQFVDYNGVYYRDNWLRSIEDGEIEYTEINIVRIEDDEYNDLKAQLDDSDMPTDNSLDNEVETIVDNNSNDEEEPEVVRKTAAQILEQQIKLAARFAEV